MVYYPSFKKEYGIWNGGESESGVTLCNYILSQEARIASGQASTFTTAQIPLCWTLGASGSKWQQFGFGISSALKSSQFTIAAVNDKLRDQFVLPYIRSRPALLKGIISVDFVDAPLIAEIVALNDPAHREGSLDCNKAFCIKNDDCGSNLICDNNFGLSKAPFADNIHSSTCKSNFCLGVVVAGVCSDPEGFFKDVWTPVAGAFNAVGKWVAGAAKTIVGGVTGVAIKVGNFFTGLFG
eukprot:gene9472-32462_t